MAIAIKVNVDLINFDIKKTLEELEGKDANRSRGSGVARNQKIRRMPVKDLSIQDIRLMVEQNSSLKYLVPLAIARLQINSLVKGDSYEGDLLNAVLTVEKKFWNDELGSYVPIMKGIAENALSNAKAKPTVYAKFLQNYKGAINIFKANVGIS